MEVRVGDLVLADPENPEKGWKLDPLVKELSGISIEMSLTDGVPIIRQSVEVSEKPNV